MTDHPHFDPAARPATEDASPDTSSLTEPALQQAQRLIQRLRDALRKTVIGQDSAVDQVLLALIARGHVLLEGVPGLGKTLLVRTLAQCFGGRFARIQFTPDLMPSDVTGHALFNLKTQAFEIRRGPVFTHLLLADEINRAPAKTQSALLEVMQETQVTIEGRSYALEEPFMVLATQNPIEQEGTYPLPEAELDRFMIKVRIDYPAMDDEVRMLAQIHQTQDKTPPQPLIKPEHLLALQRLAARLTVDPVVLQYMVELVRTTRNWPGIARGAGPRASIALLHCARAHALMHGNGFVSPDDVKAVALAALRHRLQLSAELDIEGVGADQVLEEICRAVKVPRH